MEHQNKKLSELSTVRNSQSISSKRQIYNEIRHRQGCCSQDFQPRNVTKNIKISLFQAPKHVLNPLVPMLFLLFGASFLALIIQTKGLFRMVFCTKQGFQHAKTALVARQLSQKYTLNCPSQHVNCHN